MKNIILFIIFIFSNPAYALTIDPVEALTDEKTCLKLNMYHEARGEKMRGMLEVMKITLARVQSKKFPNNICDVVWQQWPVEQFSWTKDDISDNYISDKKTWKQIDQLVELWYKDELNLKVNPEILYYQTGKVTPFFKKKLKHVYTIGKHKFYKEK